MVKWLAAETQTRISLDFKHWIQIFIRGSGIQFRRPVRYQIHMYSSNMLQCSEKCMQLNTTSESVWQTTNWTEEFKICGQVSHILLSLICVFFSFFFHWCKSRHYSKKSKNFKPMCKTCIRISVVSSGGLPIQFLKLELGACEVCLKIPSSLTQMHFRQHLFCLPICPTHSPEGPLKIISSLCTLRPFHLHC